MTHASLGALFLTTANPGINLITRSSPRGWGSEAPSGITSCPRLLGRVTLPGSQALRGLPPLPEKAHLAATLPCLRTPAWTHRRPDVWFLGSWQGAELSMAEEASPGRWEAASNPLQLRGNRRTWAVPGPRERPPDRSRESSDGPSSWPPFCFLGVGGWLCTVPVR